MASSASEPTRLGVHGAGHRQGGACCAPRTPHWSQKHSLCPHKGHHGHSLRLHGSQQEHSLSSQRIYRDTHFAGTKESSRHCYPRPFHTCAWGPMEQDTDRARHVVHRVLAPLVHQMPQHPEKNHFARTRVTTDTHFAHTGITRGTHLAHRESTETLTSQAPKSHHGIVILGHSYLCLGAHGARR